MVKRLDVSKLHKFSLGWFWLRLEHTILYNFFNLFSYSWKTCTMRLQGDKRHPCVWFSLRKLGQNRLPKKQSILFTSNCCTVHYITVLSCMGLYTWAVCLIMFEFTPVKSDSMSRSGKYSAFWTTLSFVDKVYHLLCRSVSYQHQVVLPIFFKMPHVVTVYLDFATRIPQWMLRVVCLFSLKLKWYLPELCVCRKLHSF